jgi:6-phosphofructokinase 2
VTAIVTLTMNPALDIATATEVILPATKLRCDEPRYDPGGGGINVARAVHMLGGEALAVFPMGGLSGEMLCRLLDGEGVPRAVVPVAGITRESLAVVERQSGRQYRFLLPGAPIGPSDQERCLAELARQAAAVGFVVASGSLPPGVPPDFYARVADLAGRNGSRFVLDTSGAALSGAGDDIFLLKTSLRELEELTGSAVPGVDDQERAARDIVRSGKARILVVSLGAAGALVATETGNRRYDAVPVTALGSVGAGDSMLAGIVLTLSRGWALDAAVRFGMAAGAAALLRPGTELCRRDDTERLYRENAA